MAQERRRLTSQMVTLVHGEGTVSFNKEKEQILIVQYALVSHPHVIDYCLRINKTQKGLMRYGGIAA